MHRQGFCVLGDQFYVHVESLNTPRPKDMQRRITLAGTVPVAGAAHTARVALPVAPRESTAHSWPAALIQHRQRRTTLQTHAAAVKASTVVLDPQPVPVLDSQRLPRNDSAAASNGGVGIEQGGWLRAAGLQGKGRKCKYGSTVLPTPAATEYCSSGCKECSLDCVKSRTN